MIVSANGKNSFTASDGTILGTESLKRVSELYDLEAPEGVTFTLESGITDVETDFFDRFPTLNVLYISDTVKNIALTKNARKAFMKNSVLIIGSFDTYAERFAKENKLRFLHTDIELARVGEYSTREGIDVITLELFTSGKARVKQANYCPGSSAGNNGGGEIDFYLPRDFYMTHSQKDIAKMCWGTCSEAIIKNNAFGKFLAKAFKKEAIILNSEYPLHYQNSFKVKSAVHNPLQLVSCSGFSLKPSIHISVSLSDKLSVSKYCTVSLF